MSEEESARQRRMETIPGSASSKGKQDSSVHRDGLKKRWIKKEGPLGYPNKARILTRLSCWEAADPQDKGRTL
jgi:hypothetical protein